jgi:hypothetical protein
MEDSDGLRQHIYLIEDAIPADTNAQQVIAPVRERSSGTWVICQTVGGIKNLS